MQEINFDKYILTCTYFFIFLFSECLIIFSNALWTETQSKPLNKVVIKYQALLVLGCQQTSFRVRRYSLHYVRSVW